MFKIKNKQEHSTCLFVRRLHPFVSLHRLTPDLIRPTDRGKKWLAESGRKIIKNKSTFWGALNFPVEQKPSAPFWAHSLLSLPVCGIWMLASEVGLFDWEKGKKGCRFNMRGHFLCKFLVFIFFIFMYYCCLFDFFPLLSCLKDVYCWNDEGWTVQAVSPQVGWGLGYGEIVQMGGVRQVRIWIRFSHRTGNPHNMKKENPTS